MKTAFFIFIAGGSGAVLRWGVGKLFSSFPPTFPLGVFFCNVLGCFFIGLAAGFFTKPTVTSLALTVGLLGGFTTFSSFSLDSLRLLESQNYAFFFLNTLGSVVLGLILCWLGYFIMLQVRNGSW